MMGTMTAGSMLKHPELHAGSSNPSKQQHPHLQPPMLPLLTIPTLPFGQHPNPAHPNTLPELPPLPIEAFAALLFRMWDPTPTACYSQCCMGNVGNIPNHPIKQKLPHPDFLPFIRHLVTQLPVSHSVLWQALYYVLHLRGMIACTKTGPASQANSQIPSPAVSTENSPVPAPHTVLSQTCNPTAQPNGPVHKTNGKVPNVSILPGSEFAVSAVALSLACKLLEDRPYRNKTWVKACGLLVTLDVFSHIEMEMVQAFGWKMGVPEFVMREWCKRVWEVVERRLRDRALGDEESSSDDDSYSSEVSSVDYQPRAKGQLQGPTLTPPATPSISPLRHYKTCSSLSTSSQGSSTIILDHHTPIFPANSISSSVSANPACTSLPTASPPHMLLARSSISLQSSPTFPISVSPRTSPMQIFKKRPSLTTADRKRVKMALMGWIPTQGVQEGI